MAIVRGGSALASSFFGITIRRTPFLYSALILDSSTTVLGKWKVRWNDW